MCELNRPNQLFATSVLALVIPVFLAACGTTNLPTTVPAVRSTSASQVTYVAPSITATPVPKDTVVPSTRIVSTLQPTYTPAPQATPTPAAPMHPLTIAASRQRAYPGSDILIEQTLSSGVNYDRFIVSYLSDGLKIYALMTVPHGEKPRDGWPAIVFNHGYIPPAQYRTTERYVAYVDAFARNGYIVFKSDYRGHGLSEGEPRSYGFPDYTTDVLNAVASVKRYTQTDPDRIGMYGHSMGGYLTLRAMVITKDIKAGAIWAGVVGSYADIAQMWFNTPAAGSSNAGEQNWVQAFYSNIGTPASNPTFWDAISANTYAADLSGPVQLQHARTDTHVPITMSDQLAEQIRVVGGSVEYFKYDVDDHNLTSNLGIALSRTLAFFDKTLKR